MTGYQECFDLLLPEYPRKEAQEVENHRAVAAMYELAENAISTAENYVMYTEGRLPALAARGSDLIAACEELKARYRHEAPCGWTEDKVMQHCDQRFTRGDIAATLSRPSLDVNGVRSILQGFSGAPTELPRGRFLLMKDNLTMLKPHQPFEIIRDLSDVCGALYEMQYVDLAAEIRAELAEFDIARDKAQMDVDDAVSAFNSAVAGGDVIAVELAHRKLITARYELCVIYAKRLGRLLGDDIAKQDLKFAKEMDNLKMEAEEATRQFADAIRNTHKIVREDVGSSERHRKAQEEAHARAVEAFRQSDKESDEALARMVVWKRKVIEELRQKAQELKEIMMQQRAIVEAQAKAKRQEEERITAYNEFMYLEGQMRARLSRCQEYCDRVESVVPILEEYVKDMVKRFPRESLREAVDKISDIEASKILEAYRQFVSCCGDLTVKKMHRLDTLERQARLVEHNRNSAMESLDPNMNGYRTEFEEILEQMKGVTGVIDALNSTQDAGEQVFQSVEEGVRAKCRREKSVFVHPLQEYGIVSLDERSRFVNGSMRYVEGEERVVNEKKHVLSRMRLAVEEDEAATESALRSRPADGI